MNYEAKKKKFVNFLALIGTVALLNKSFKSFIWIKKYFFTIEKNFLKEYGNGWILITGASEGLGKSYAKELYKNGYNIIIVSRNELKIKSTIEEIKYETENNMTGFTNKIEYFQFDFGENFTKESKELLEKKLKYYEINILINNVGTAYLNYLEQLTDEEIQKIININIVNTTFLNKIIINQMKKRRKKSLVVFVGSDLVNFNPPFLQVYNSSKSYLKGLSESLEKENENIIDFTYLAPGPIETNLNPRKHFFKVKADDYAQKSIKQFGNYNFSYGHFFHAIKNAIFNQNLVKYYITNKLLKQEFKPKK